MAGGRNRETLLDRVIAQTFRPKRYGDLLLEPALPATRPEELKAPWSPGYADAIWSVLVKWQGEYAWLPENNPELTAYAIEQRPTIAAEFADAMHHLHGGRRPEWLREYLQSKDWEFDGPDEPIDGPDGR